MNNKNIIIIGIVLLITICITFFCGILTTIFVLNVKTTKDSLTVTTMTNTRNSMSTNLVDIKKVNEVSDSNIKDARNAIDKKYPELKDWESTKFFAGGGVFYANKLGVTYVAFAVYGSGIPLAKLDCYAVDNKMNVVKLKEGRISTSAGNIDPINCTNE